MNVQKPCSLFGTQCQIFDSETQATPTIVVTEGTTISQGCLFTGQSDACLNVAQSDPQGVLLAESHSKHANYL